MAANVTFRNSGTRPINKPPRRLPWPLDVFGTSVGKKTVMAVTGLMMYGFVFAHMFGNLKLYLGVVEHNGTVAYDADIYAAGLRNLLVPILPENLALWLMRSGLIVATILHVTSAYSLTVTNWRAKESYQSKRDWIAANFAGKTMRYTGVITLGYIMFHLADLTFGRSPNYEFIPHNVQHNVVESFSSVGTSTIYIIANLAIGLHLFHGLYSMFQTLGISNPKLPRRYLRAVATTLAGVVVAVNISFPIAVLTDVIQYRECPTGVEASVEANCIDPHNYLSDHGG